MAQIKNINHLTYRRFGFSVNDCFLTGAPEFSASINYFIQSPTNVKESLNEFYTLLIDLNQTQDTIWNKIYKRTQVEIDSFINNQIFEHQILFNISNAQLVDFIHLFNQFAQFKNIRAAEVSRLKAYNKNGILAISYIKQRDKILCVNFYRVTKERATNLYSFHLKHVLGDIYSNSHYGRAHRAIHWLDILEFKKSEIHFYDFCGWYHKKDDSDLLNINRFKEQFSGTVVKEYSGVIYKNKFLKWLKKLR